MFIVNINSTVLHFEIREFAVITGLKCGMESNFISDPAIPKRLIDLYFKEMTK